MKKFLDYNGLAKYTSLLNTSFAKLENGAVSEDVLPMSAKDVVEFDGFCTPSVIIENETPIVSPSKVRYFVNGKRFVANKEDVLGYYGNFSTSDLYQKTDGDSKQPYSNKIYVDVSSENSSLYRWNGTDLIRISDTSKLEWVNITDKPNLVTDVSSPTYDNTGLHFSVSYTQGVSNSIVIPEASSDSSGVITPDTYTYIELLKQSNAGAWSEFISRYGVVDASKIAGTTTDTTVKLNIPYDTVTEDGPQSNTQTVTFYGATTSNAGLMTAKDKRLFDTYIDDQYNSILYYNPIYTPDKVKLGHTTDYNPDPRPGVATTLPINKDSTIAAATSTTAGVMTANDKLKLDAVYNRQTFIFIAAYVETGELLHSSIETAGRRYPVSYIANENAFAVRVNNQYYNNWSEASNYGVLDSNGNWIPKNDTLYISTQDFSMYVYYDNKLNKIN